MNYKMCVPCLLGLEGPIADELKRLNIPDVRSENGRVYFGGGDSELARANVCLRIGERVLIEVGTFEAKSFDALFEGSKLKMPSFSVHLSLVMQYSPCS